MCHFSCQCISKSYWIIVHSKSERLMFWCRLVSQEGASDKPVFTGKSYFCYSYYFFKKIILNLNSCSIFWQEKVRCGHWTNVRRVLLSIILVKIDLLNVLECVKLEVKLLKPHYRVVSFKVV